MSHTPAKKKFPLEKPENKNPRSKEEWDTYKGNREKAPDKSKPGTPAHRND